MLMITCDMLIDHGDIPRQKSHVLNLMMLTKAVGKETFVPQKEHSY